MQFPAVNASLPKRLGYFPFWRGEERFLDAMEPIYAAASPLGLDVVLGERRSGPRQIFDTAKTQTTEEVLIYRTSLIDHDAHLIMETLQGNWVKVCEARACLDPSAR